MNPPTETGARDAFLLLVALAIADRVTTCDEVTVLDDFRRHLGIDLAKAKRYQRLARRSAATRIPDREQGRIDLLSMLIRVAWSDGRMQTEERQFLDRVAETLQIPVVTKARLLHDGEIWAKTHRGHVLRTAMVAGSLLVIGGIGLAFALSRQGDEEMVAFREIEARYAPSVLLIHVEYAMRAPVDDGRVARCTSTGTGFFITAEGLLLTNKHVVEPWKFRGEAGELAGEGFSLDKASVRMFAWPGGGAIHDAQGQLSFDAAWRSDNGTLRIVATAPDVMHPLVPAPGSLVQCYHVPDNHDLALLQVTLATPVVPLLLARHTGDVGKLDPVLVMGYPRGLKILEGSCAVSSPTIGRVRKAEDSIYITAPIVSGNSGGPVLDARGRVIAVATRIGGDSTLGCCIRAEHIHELIPAGVRVSLP